MGFHLDGLYVVTNTNVKITVHIIIYELRSYHEIKTLMYIVGEAWGLSSYTMTCNERNKFSLGFLYSFATYSYSDPGNKDLFL